MYPLSSRKVEFSYGEENVEIMKKAGHNDRVGCSKHSRKITFPEDSDEDTNWDGQIKQGCLFYDTLDSQTITNGSEEFVNEEEGLQLSLIRQIVPKKEAEITIFISIGEGLFMTIRASPASEFGVVRKELMRRAHLTRMQLRLIFGGRIIRDNEFIYELGISDGSTVFTIWPIVGGVREKGLGSAIKKGTASKVEVEVSSIPN